MEAADDILNYPLRANILPVNVVYVKSLLDQVFPGNAVNWYVNSNMKSANPKQLLGNTTQSKKEKLLSTSTKNITFSLPCKYILKIK